MSVINKARRVAAKFGLEVFRAEPMTVWRKRLPALLKRNDVDLVLDIGANDGGFASELVQNGYQGKILSFEPLPAAWQKLRERAQKEGFGRWEVAPRIALGAEDGEVDFFESANSVSSSLLPMLSSHIEAAPNSAPRQTLKVPVKTLDEVITAFEAKRVYIKIDVQGAEHLVLAGAQRTLEERAIGLQLEMSLTPLYEGQRLNNELHDELVSKGFKLWDIVPGFRNPGNLRLMQYDGVYLK